MEDQFLNMKLFPEFKGRDSQKGIAIYLAVAALSIVMAVALGVSALAVYQMKSMNEAGNSVVAFGAAESGIEWASSPWYGVDELLDSSNYQVACPPDASSQYVCRKDFSLGSAKYTVTVSTSANSLTCPVNMLCIKSVGVYRGTQRVIKIQQE